MNQGIKSLIILAIFASLFYGCKKENMCDCFKSTGKDVTISRDVIPFDTIQVYDKVDVYVHEEAAFSVKIEGGKNVVGLISTEINNNTLTIKNNNKCNFVRSYKKRIKVHIGMPKVNWIRHSGIGNVYSEGVLTTDTITYQIFSSGDVYLNVNNQYLRGGIHGMGDLYLKGNTNYHNTNVKGEGFIHAEDLATQTTDIVAITSGETRIQVNGTLIALLEQSGNVYYKGNPPVIQKTIKGKGQLIPIQ